MWRDSHDAPKSGRGAGKAESILFSYA